MRLFRNKVFFRGGGWTKLELGNCKGVKAGGKGFPNRPKMKLKNSTKRPRLAREVLPCESSKMYRELINLRRVNQ